MNYKNSYKLGNKNKQTEKEIRRIQTIHGNSIFILVLPENFVTKLKIAKGEIKQLIRISVYNLWKVSNVYVVLKP